jgi:uncharacterized membrane protein
MGRALNALVIAGVILVLLGITGLAVPVFTTQRTTEVAKLGDLKIDARENQVHSIPPVVSAGALIAGVILIGGGLYRRP